VSAMAPKKKGKKSSEPQLSGPEAQAEMERKLLIEEAKALKKRKELEELQFNEFQQEKVGRHASLPAGCLSFTWAPKHAVVWCGVVWCGV
jgi:hypothetical protein